MNLVGANGGAWTAQTHAALYPANLNRGLVRYIAEEIAPKDFVEFGSGECLLANALAAELNLSPSYCLEPFVRAAVRVDRGLSLLNVDATHQPTPSVLNHKFDLVLSIEVAEHVARDRHEALFDFLVSRARNSIVFSGARPGQGGHGHIAERPESEWREEFVSRGMLFDSDATLAVRAASDTKNINHRRNLQIFRRPERYAALDVLEARAKPYLRDLVAIVQRHGDWLDGNLFYVDLPAAIGGMPEDSLKEKRLNVLNTSRAATNVLEIGFNAGHSALLILLASPNLKLTVIDLFDHSYTQDCFDYLSSVFPGRLVSIEGSSVERLGELGEATFDFIHFDGGKDATISEDLCLSQRIVKRDHLLVIDDTQNVELDRIVSKKELEGVIEMTPWEPANGASGTRRWQHRLARFSHDTESYQKIFDDLDCIYSDTDFASIYTNRDQNGQRIGAARALGLIDAIRTVERERIEGAFVELGVAGGHSSVIAALAASKYYDWRFYLYDTFEGFGDLPDECDLSGIPFSSYDLSKYASEDCSTESVLRRMLATGLSPDRLWLAKGPAEQTLPLFHPGAVSILRLDMDLYKPTLHALRTLYDNVSVGGFVIIDDYGHWQGCRKAVDEFFEERGEKFDPVQLDYTCFMVRR